MTEEERHKVCSGCHQDLPFSRYYKDRAKKFGLSTRCAACMKTDARIARQELAKRDPDDVPVPQSKVCASCHVAKHGSEFNRSAGRTDGRQTYCRPCSSVDARLRRMNR